MGLIGDSLRSASGVTFESCIRYWKSLYVESEEDYNTVLDNFRIVFSCNSSCIEGEVISYRNTKEIFECGSVTGYTGSTSAVITVSNQKRLFPIMIRDLVQKRPLSDELIKEYHSVLLMGLYDDVRYGKGERAGTYKVNDYCVGLSDAGSHPEDVPRDINELLTELNGFAGVEVEDVLKAACYFHCAFESIHPFADGNGRLGRLLMNYILMMNGLPPVTVFDEDKNTYYLALEVYDRTGEISGMVAFIKEQIVKTWKSRVR